jgi:hypothetical protein
VALHFTLLKAGLFQGMNVEGITEMNMVTTEAAAALGF